MIRHLVAELPGVIVRLAIAFLVYDLVLRIPWPEDAAPWVALVAAGGLIATVLILCGKLLYDTFYPLQSQHSRSTFFYPKERR
jgi:hypothetical protein